MMNPITAGPDHSVGWRLRALSFLAVASLLVVGAGATASPAEAHEGVAVTEEEFSTQQELLRQNFRDEMVIERHKFSDKMAKADQNFRDEMAKADQKFSDEMAKADQKFSDEMELLEKKFGAEPEKFLLELVNHFEKFNDKMAKADQNFRDEMAKADRNFSHEMAKADRKFSDEMAKADQKFLLKEQLRLEEFRKQQEELSHSVNDVSDSADPDGAVEEPVAEEVVSVETPGDAPAVDPNVLGTAGDFKLLAGAALTAPGSTIYGNVGAGAALTAPGSTIYGNVGAGAAVTMPATSVAGSVTAGAALTTDGLTAIENDPRYQPSDVGIALNDLAAAYGTLRAVPATAALAGDLSGQTLKPGVYHADAAFTISGNLTLDGEHNDGARFIFQGDGAMVTAALSRIILINGANADNVFWVLDGAATFGANSTIRGNIVSNAAITFGANSDLHGSALSVRAAITMPLSSAQ
jgi:hypothetical protein